jgi:Leucine-rich repeat (LRR) protein
MEEASMEKAFVLAWKAIAAAEDRHAALIEHFWYLADAPGFEPVLEAVMKAVVDVTVNDKENAEGLILHFPGNEKLYAYAPDPAPSESYPQSFRNVLLRHSELHLENAIITLGDHGLFDEGDGWYGALENEGSDLVEFGLDTILSPMSDYSDLWLYHPGVKNAYGEPTLYYLSHEGGDIDDPQDWNIGSLFLVRAADTLNLKIVLPAPEGAPEPADWWNGLSDAWKAALRDRWGISEPDHAGKAFQEQDLYISDEFQVESLEPARVLRKLKSIDCRSQEIRDLSPLADLPALSSVQFTSKAITDFSPLAQCKALTSVTLSETSVADLTFASGLVKLKTLECNDTAVSDASPLEGLAKLETLELRGAPIASIKPLQALVKLQKLFFVYSDVIDTNDLARLTALRSLSLKGKVLSLEGLRGMKKLIYLWIQDLTPVDGEPFSLEPLAGLKRLDTLYLSATPFVSLEPLYSLSSLTRIFVDRKLSSPELEAELKVNMPRCRLVF